MTTTAPLRESGDRRLDFWCRVLAIDLFVDPTGVRTLVEAWMHSTTDAFSATTGVSSPTLVGSIARLIALLSELDGLLAPPPPLDKDAAPGLPIDFRIAVRRIPGASAKEDTFEYHLRLFGAEQLELYVDGQLLIQRGRQRTLVALAQMMEACIRKRYGVMMPPPFRLVDNGGMFGDLICQQFRGNELVSQLLTPSYFLVEFCFVFIEALKRFNPVGAPAAILACVRRDATLGVAAVFKQHAFNNEERHTNQFRSLLAQFFKLFVENADNIDELSKHVDGVVKETEKRMQRFASQIIRTTRLATTDAMDLDDGAM